MKSLTGVTIIFLVLVASTTAAPIDSQPAKGVTFVLPVSSLGDKLIKL